MSQCDVRYSSFSKHQVPLITFILSPRSKGLENDMDIPERILFRTFCAAKLRIARTRPPPVSIAAAAFSRSVYTFRTPMRQPIMISTRSRFQMNLTCSFLFFLEMILIRRNKASPVPSIISSCIVSSIIYVWSVSKICQNFVAASL